MTKFNINDKITIEKGKLKGKTGSVYSISENVCTIKTDSPLDCMMGYPEMQLEDISLIVESDKVDVLASLKIVSKSRRGEVLKFKDGSKIKINADTAKSILKVYGAVNSPNKKKMVEMLSNSRGSFQHVADFACGQS